MSKRVKSHALLAIKGMVIGATMLVPGVSGGSMAMILGIYDKLVSSVSSFFKHIKESLIFLEIAAAGGIVGMVLFARPLEGLIQAYPKPMLYFFIGAVVGGIPLMYQKAEIKKFSFKVPLYIVVGILVTALFGLFPADTVAGAQGSTGIGILLIAGVVAAIALVLPGISVSYLLLLLGIYDRTLNAIGSFDIGYLMPLGIGLVIGVIATTKVLEYAMKKFPQPTYLMILGFVVGSLAEVYPGLPEGIEWVICAVTLLAGFGIIRYICSLGFGD